MKLSGHQEKILACVHKYVNQDGLEQVTYNTISGWLKADKINGIGRRILIAYEIGNTMVYNLHPMVGKTLEEVKAELELVDLDFRRKPRAEKPTPVQESEPVEVKSAPSPVHAQARKISMGNDQAPGFYIPTKDATFISFGPMKQLDQIISSGEFLPTYIFGDTGIAKSMSVIQACARHKRELFRVNVNINTDEEDFIGGFRLIDGETIFQKGPLVLAMERGAILLVDEISALSPANAFCLFSVLEGGELYIKKTNEKIRPEKGFNIIVTDNTKGKGSTTGRFVGTNVQNDALLDRFVIALEYTYPSPAQELRILNAVDPSNQKLNQDLIKWANIVRTSFADGLVDESVSVRKLVSILNINKVFQDMKTSISLALNRYEAETKDAIVGLFEKVVIDPNYGDVNFDDPEVELTEAPTEAGTEQ